VGIQRARAYLKEHGMAGKQVNANIEDSTLRIRRMDLPEMPDGDMKIAIRWNFREYVDGPIEKYSVDYSAFGDIKVNGDKRPILAYAVSNDSVAKLSELIKQTGLKPVSIEPNATALLAIFDHNVGWKKGEFYVMIDIGSKVSNFIAMGGGCLLFSRPLTTFGMDGLIKQIVKDVSCPPDKAGAYVSALLKNALPAEIQEKVSVCVQGFLGAMAVEIQRSVDAFCMMFHVEKVEAIYLSGGGSMISGITDSFTKNLGITTRLFNPFEKIDMRAAGGVVPNAQLYAVAAGLAMPKG
jgi:type IV pilus assembly protein PilM